MAKKKKATKKVTAKKAKTVTSKKTTRKAVRKTKSSRRKSNRPESVDGILKKFQNERTSQEIRLEKIKSKILDLEKKTQAYRQQIDKLTEQEIEVEQSISNLDARRDQEIGEVLSKLGVQVSTPSATQDSTPMTEDAKNERSAETSVPNAGNDKPSGDENSDTGEA